MPEVDNSAILLHRPPLLPAKVCNKLDPAWAEPALEQEVNIAEALAQNMKAALEEDNLVELAAQPEVLVVNNFHNLAEVALQEVVVDSLALGAHMKTQVEGNFHNLAVASHNQCCRHLPPPLHPHLK